MHVHLLDHFVCLSVRLEEPKIKFCVGHGTNGFVVSCLVFYVFDTHFFLTYVTHVPESVVCDSRQFLFGFILFKFIRIDCEFRYFV